MSKRKMCFVPTSLAIFDYEDVKPVRSGMLSHISVLGIKSSKGKYNVGWAKKYPKQTCSLISIQQLSINLGKYFAYKKLGILSPKPSIPPGFKLIKVKAQGTTQPKDAYSSWKKAREALRSKIQDKSYTNVFCGAGPKQRVVGSKGSVADFFIPLSRYLESKTVANPLLQCSRLNQTDKESVIAKGGGCSPAGRREPTSHSSRGRESRRIKMFGL